MQNFPKIVQARKKALTVFLSLCLFSHFFGFKAYARVFDSEKIHLYLKSQQSSKTGLVKSFSNILDEKLQDQSSTYDQGLAVIAFLLLGDYKAASRILNFFQSKWNSLGFVNFYNTRTGVIGIESTIHLGPNMWIALAALQYDAITGQRKYLKLAKRIAVWSTKLNHLNGGIAMGPFADWGADWKNVFSAENNIDAYVVFDMLEKILKNKFEKKLFYEQKQGIKRFLAERILSLKPRIPAGVSENIMASDVLAFAVLAFDPAELKNDFNLDVDEAMDILEKNFYVQVDGISGYDFTDFETKKTFNRQHMISIEWSAMIALSYLKAAQYYGVIYNENYGWQRTRYINNYMDRATRILDNLDKKAIAYTQNRLAYPYATKALEQVFPFAPWWKTPGQGGYGKLPGSLSGTCWRLFAEEQFNPFNLYRK